MKSARHNRLLRNAEMPYTLMTVDQINEARSFGAKTFAKKKTRRKMANGLRFVQTANRRKTCRQFKL